MGQVQRRQIVIAVGAILATPFVRAQKPPLLRLGLLWLGSPETTNLRTLCSTAYAAKATVKGAPSPSTTEAPLATTKSSSKLPPIWCSRRWWSAGGMCPGSVTVRLLRVQNRSQVGNRLDDNIHALSRGVGISAFDLYFVQPSTDQKIQALLHVVGQAGRSLHLSRIKQFARSVGVSLPMQLFSHCSLHSPPEPLNPLPS
jgi:hypothetical protein